MGFLMLDRALNRLEVAFVPAGARALSPQGLGTRRAGSAFAAFCKGISPMKMQYSRFLAMIATSTVAMFALMYLNTYAWDHVRFSETRVYAALYMGATMAIIMLAFMLGMYTNRRANAAILVGSVLVFAAALFLLRSQITVGDVSYMRAMIPHHSIAILTSERARITDPRVRALADGIIEAQRREIAEMEALIADLGGGPPATPEIDGK
jgi:hypothetical protein